MKKIIIEYFKSPFGELVLGSVDEKLCLCDWRHRKMRQAIDNRLLKGIGGVFSEDKTEFPDHAIQQLQEYFSSQETTI